MVQFAANPDSPVPGEVKSWCLLARNFPMSVSMFCKVGSPRWKKSTCRNSASYTSELIKVASCEKSSWRSSGQNFACCWFDPSFSLCILPVGVEAQDPQRRLSIDDVGRGVDLDVKPGLINPVYGCLIGKVPWKSIKSWLLGEYPPN